MEGCFVRWFLFASGIVLSALAFAVDQTPKTLNRAPAAAAPYSCAYVAQSAGPAALEEKLSAQCNRAQPFSISEVTSAPGELATGRAWLVCCPKL